MSTRCKVRIKDSQGHIDFYHHHDGYPEGVGFKLLKLVDSFPIPKPYWGEDEPDMSLDLNTFIRTLIEQDKFKQFEFDTHIHSDIEYQYEVNLETRDISCINGHYKYSESETGDRNYTFLEKIAYDVKGMADEWDSVPDLTPDNSNVNDYMNRSHELYLKYGTPLRG